MPGRNHGYGSCSHTELFRQFMDNAGFKRWLTDTVFTLAYEQTDVA